MKEEAKILMADLSIIDRLARVWHEMYRDRINKKVLVAQASVALATPPVTEESGVMEEPTPFI
jgi:hypothetical protein